MRIEIGESEEVIAEIEGDLAEEESEDQRLEPGLDRYQRSLR